MVKPHAKVLITGGTSGLGKSLVRQFLSNGNEVTALGKSRSVTLDSHQRLNVSFCDFSKLSEIHGVVDAFALNNQSFDLLVNNAGILSPPHIQETVDGFELSYQVNFLSHALLTHLLLKRDLLRPGLVVNVSSPIYRKGNPNVVQALDQNNYTVLRAYANTKLYMAMLSEKLAGEGIPAFSFDPGTFSSGIYRMQQRWFHFMYKIASPFMRSSDAVAEGLYSIIHENNWQNGWVINRRGYQRQLNNLDSEQKTAFWKQVNEQMAPYLE